MSGAVHTSDVVLEVRPWPRGTSRAIFIALASKVQGSLGLESCIDHFSAPSSNSRKIIKLKILTRNQYASPPK